MPRFQNLLPMFLLGCCSLASGLHAQEVQLPENPEQWLNSDPITGQQLEGKAALLYFFEEG